MSKRILSLVLALSLVLTVLAPGAMALEAGEDTLAAEKPQVRVTEEKDAGKKHPMSNALVSQGKKDSDVQLVTPGLPTGNASTASGLQPSGNGSWSYRETENKPSVELLNREYQKALAELKLEAETHEAWFGAHMIWFKDRPGTRPEMLF